MEDPGVVCSGEVRQGDTRLLRGARHMRQGSGFIREHVIGRLPGRDASLRRMYASDGVPMQAKAHRRGDSLAITMTV